MNTEPTEGPRERGSRVWQSLADQMAEGHGFLTAMTRSFSSALKRNLRWLLLFFLIGGTLGFLVWVLVPQVYEAEMTVSYVHYEKKIYADMLAKLDLLIDAKSYDPLSAILGLPPAEVRKLRSIKAFNIRGESLLTDLSTEKVPFYIRVRVKEIDLLPGLQRALVSYMNGTDFIQARLHYERERAEAELVFYQARLVVVDSLSQVLHTHPEKAGNQQALTRMDLLEETKSIYNRIQELQGTLAFNLNIEVLDGFIASDQPLGKPFIHWILYGGLLGIALRILILALR